VKAVVYLQSTTASSVFQAVGIT